MLLSQNHRIVQPWLPRDAGNPERWLRNTPALQIDHPKLQIQVKKLTQLRSGQEQKAVACFQFIRGLPFKAVPDPTAFRSVDVLRARSGDGHTKGLLFVAMLRSLCIPSRLRAVSLGPGFLHGLFSTHGSCVNHVVTEVHLGGQWMGVDAYCVDLQLGLAARVSLLRDGRRVGYGVHMNGQVVWEGKGDAFGCFCLNDPSSLPIADLGVYDDPAQLADRGLAPRLGWVDRAGRGIGTVLLNRRVDALRRSLRPAERPAAEAAAAN